MTSNKEHPHAEVLRAIADGVPLSEFECRHNSRSTWGEVRFCYFVGEEKDEWQVRRKTRTMTLNGITFPWCVEDQGLMEDDQSYWHVDFAVDGMVRERQWNWNAIDERLYHAGLIQLTEEGARLQAEAMLVSFKSDAHSDA